LTLIHLELFDILSRDRFTANSGCRVHFKIAARTPQSDRKPLLLDADEAGKDAQRIS
jgi:hypothetical protein